MLVILTDNQILSPRHVCPGCLLADGSGQPRWHEDRLSCGRPLQSLGPGCPAVFECQMGFQVARLASCAKD